MKSSAEIKQIAINTILTESRSVEKLATYIDEDFVETVKLLYHSKGRVIVSGIGKSANIANKIVATFNSTGTPAIFMHAADAIHGDLGIIQQHDVVICISKSGNTPEIKVLVPLIQRFGNKIIALVAQTDSFLARNADFILKSIVEKEACPNNLAPTTSTTAQLVIGDALAVALLECRNFDSADFAKYHPGGSLGKKLYLRVKDLYQTNEVPKVTPNTKINDVILEISSKRLGAAAVVDQHNALQGIITDGDLRRMLQLNVPLNKLTAKDIMSANAKVIGEDELAVNAFDMMKKNSITQLVVLKGDKYLGMVHIHDILREGIV
ncbi:MAG: D-arabinose 5-phosphate isomerase [Bacteroidia bacterium]|nr:MAG: D-arabinose 5-phosphate isomerase [Bacteroidia bacterium]